MKTSELKKVDSIRILGAQSIGFSSEEEGTSWAEMEISLVYIKDDRPTEPEKMPFLKFKQLVKTADSLGITVETQRQTGDKASCSEGGTCGGSCGGQSVDIDSVIGLARKLIKEEARSYDPSVM